MNLALANKLRGAAAAVGDLAELRELLNTAADALETAVDIVYDFHIFDSVPDDHGYVGSGLEKKANDLARSLGVELIPHPGIDQPEAT